MRHLEKTSRNSSPQRSSPTIVLEFAPLDLPHPLPPYFKGFLTKPFVLSSSFVVCHVEESKSFARITTLMFLVFSSLVIVVGSDFHAFPQFDRRVLYRTKRQRTQRVRDPAQTGSFSLFLFIPVMPITISPVVWDAMPNY